MVIVVVFVGILVVLFVVSFVDFLLEDDDFLLPTAQIVVFSDHEILVPLADSALFVHMLWLLFPPPSALSV